LLLWNGQTGIRTGLEFEIDQTGTKQSLLAKFRKEVGAGGEGRTLMTVKAAGF
jgi:hypothetical protein